MSPKYYGILKGLRGLGFRVRGLGFRGLGLRV